MVWGPPTAVQELGREVAVDALHIGPEGLELVVEEPEGALHHLALLRLTSSNLRHLKQSKMVTPQQIDNNHEGTQRT